MKFMRIQRGWFELRATGLAVALGAFATAAQAAVIDFNDLSLYGRLARTSPTVINDGAVLQMTAPTGGTGVAYIPDPFEVTASLSFSTAFRFNIWPQGADGLSFVVQNDPRGVLALGEGGVAMAYGAGTHPELRIINSVIVELDHFRNFSEYGQRVNDPNANHVGINLNGRLESVITATPPGSLEGGLHWAWIDYMDGFLKVYLAQGAIKPTAPLINYEINIASIVGDQAYFGFASTTGGLNSGHYIEYWSLDVSNTAAPEPVPLPASLGFGVLGLAGLGLASRRR